MLEGIVYQLNVKPQDSSSVGLPKEKVSQVAVGVDGIVGDHNHYRHAKKGNTPDRAVMLLPYEIIEQLNAEGWPVRPGDLGENITAQHLINDLISVGQRYRVGDVVLEVTEPVNPCYKLQFLPYVGDRNPEFMKALLGRRGWYFKVLEEGKIQAGGRIRQLS